MNRILTWLRSFQNISGFANYALHAWCGAFCVTSLAESISRWLAIAIFISLAAAKEFGYDLHMEIQSDGSVGQPLKNATDDFVGYALGVVVAALAWALPWVIEVV